MPHEIRTSTYAILKRDITNKKVRIIKANDVIEYHIYRKNLPNKIVLPRPILWAIIVCNFKHVMKNNKQGLEVHGTRYSEEALRIYLRKTDKVNRVAHSIRFKQ